MSDEGSWEVFLQEQEVWLGRLQLQTAKLGVFMAYFVAHFSWQWGLRHCMIEIPDLKVQSPKGTPGMGSVSRRTPFKGIYGISPVCAEGWDDITFVCSATESWEFGYLGTRYFGAGGMFYESLLSYV